MSVICKPLCDKHDVIRPCPICDEKAYAKLEDEANAEREKEEAGL